MKKWLFVILTFCAFTCYAVGFTIDTVDSLSYVRSYDPSILTLERLLEEQYENYPANIIEEIENNIIMLNKSKQDLKLKININIALFVATETFLIIIGLVGIKRNRQVPTNSSTSSAS